ncbi:hypothetical protein ACVDG5_031475 [Mesorhizobium sp. ORM6]
MQAQSIGAAGKDERLEVLTDGGETDDVAFLLMGSPNHGPLADRDTSRTSGG